MTRRFDPHRRSAQPVVTLAVLCAVAALACLAPAVAVAQNAAGDADKPTLAEQSLPLRTALHHDPTLDAPLQALVKIYRHENQLDELLSLYAQHLQRWPNDASARTVHVRLLLSVTDPTALAAARAAVQVQPEHAFFRYLLYRALDADGEEGTLDQLHLAIEKCKQPHLQREWIDVFLPLAAAEGRDEQVTQHLKTLSSLAGNDAVARLDVARKMMSLDRAELALQTLDQASKLDMPAEASVELSMTTAQALAELGRTQDAAAQLDQLLDRVSTDYWRRPEIVRQRLGLVETDVEREKMIQLATKRVADSPGDASAVISLADLLVGFERYRSALTHLREAAEQMPESRALEQATLALMDHMRDEGARSAFLRQRLEREPDRRDLRVRLANSLYLLGRDEQALAQIEIAIKGQDEAEQFEQLLQAARFLRESALVEQSVSLFERAIRLRPARLDVKRELAEVYLSLDEREKVRGLFTEAQAPDAAIENVLDLADFLIDKDFLSEAQALIAPSIERLPTHLDLRLLALRIHGETADSRAGTGVIDRTRALADTTARYRRWLEASVEFHANFDTIESFLAAEGQRLGEPPEQWGDAVVQRRLAFVEVAASNRAKDSARVLLTAALNQSPPQAVDQRFRRELLALLDTRQDRAELQQMLSELAVQGDAFRDEANARLAVLHIQNNRTDLAMPLLADIDYGKIRELSLLRELQDAFNRTGYNARELQLMERMVELNPTSRALWESWLQMLALRGDETRFRAAVRKLSMGIEKMPLNGESRLHLRTHLLSSYWRSIGHLEQRSDADALNQALGLLASAQQIVHEPRELAWIVWLRASMLNRLGRVAARDEALFELDRIARLSADPAHDGTDTPAEAERSADEVYIVFPDGLQVSLAEARRVLTEPQPDDVLPGDRQGPVPTSGKVTQRWSFELTRSNIISVYRGVDDQVVVLDDAGGLWGVDRTSGKLLWHQPDLLPPFMSTGRASWVQAVNPTPIRASEDRLIGTDGWDVVCVSLRDRAVLWRSPLHFTSVSKRRPAAPAGLVIDGSHVVAYDAAGHQLAWFDLDTGKLVETLSLQHPDAEVQQPPNAGFARLSRNGDRLLVIGSTITIVQLSERRVAWRFDPQSAAQFPIRLKAPDPEEQTATQTGPVATAQSWSSAHQSTVVLHSSSAVSQRQRASVSFSSSRGQTPVQYINYQQAPNLPHLARQRGASYMLTSPVVAWLQQANASRSGAVHLLNDRIVLMSSSETVSWSYRNPLGAQTIGASGTLLGFSGKHAMLLQARYAQRFDAYTNAITLAPIEEAGLLHDGRVDGPVTYVAGQQGVVAFNTVTGKRMWFYPWPDLEPAQDQPVAPSLIERLEVQQQTYLPDLVVSQNQQGQVSFRPLVARPIEGVLYVTRGPNQLIAIEGVER